MIDLETILDRANLNRAYKAVVSNKGSAGVDGMEVSDLLAHLKAHGADLVKSIAEGRYRPLPVRRVFIPKENGQKRPLGIPTAVDRFVQQAVAQVLAGDYENVFSDGSHGFRPYRSCGTAISQALAYANDGYRWIVDLDLAKFFDTVNHSKLLQVLSKRVKDRRVIRLVHRMLRAPVSVDGKVEAREIGTPQGGPVSPVLANILLNELDKELERRGHRFVRYADDMIIFCRSKKAAYHTLEHIRPFIEEKLFLKLNEEKTKVRHIASPDVKFLGFGFWHQPNRKGGTAIIDCRPHQKSQLKCKAKLKELTSRSRGQSLDEFRRKLREFVRGWVGYFRYSSMRGFVKSTDEWLRRRIRQIYWKQWKKVSMRYRALMKLGAPQGQAWQWANARKSYWRIANSWILHQTLTTLFLRSKGWVCLGDVYF
jgi:group II intron reverse transcriptase/maturase